MRPVRIVEREVLFNPVLRTYNGRLWSLRVAAYYVSGRRLGKKVADTKLGFEFEEKRRTRVVTSAASLHANNAFGVLLLLAPIKRTHAHRHLDALRRHGETYPGSAPQLA